MAQHCFVLIKYHLKLASIVFIMCWRSFLYQQSISFSIFNVLERTQQVLWRTFLFSTNSPDFIEFDKITPKLPLFVTHTRSKRHYQFFELFILLLPLKTALKKSTLLVIALSNVIVLFDDILLIFIEIAAHYNNYISNVRYFTTTTSSINIWTG